MSSRGKAETDKLRQNVEQQLNRLLAQLQDLEDEKDSLDAVEYNAMRDETLDQMKQVQQNLQDMMKGNMTLVSELDGVQLAIQAAISQAYKTPEVIRMFANKNTAQLRQRYAAIQRDSRLNNTQDDSTVLQQQVEILSALQKLGEPLSPEESSFLTKHKNAAIADLEKVAPGSVQQGILKTASISVKNSSKT